MIFNHIIYPVDFIHFYVVQNSLATGGTSWTPLSIVLSLPSKIGAHYLAMSSILVLGLTNINSTNSLISTGLQLTSSIPLHKLVPHSFLC
jgi:cytosine/uracil/thiamine/allantoin permease